MTSTQIRNHEVMIEFWASDVARDLEHLASLPPSWMLRLNPRNDLRVHGLMLGDTRQRLEAARGLDVSGRRAAFDAYIEAANRSREIFEEGKDGGVVGWVGTTLLEPWDERVEKAEQLADDALLRWCAE
jgi:hypothetical protein